MQTELHRFWLYLDNCVTGFFVDLLASGMMIMVVVVVVMMMMMMMVILNVLGTRCLRHCVTHPMVSL